MTLIIVISMNMKYDLEHFCFIAFLNREPNPRMITLMQDDLSSLLCLLEMPALAGLPSLYLLLITLRVFGLRMRQRNELQWGRMCVGRTKTLVPELLHKETQF